MERGNTEITFIRELEIQQDAWRLIRDASISLPDSWMLACAASIPNAELWVSHDHSDGFVKSARIHHQRVFTLADNPNLLP